MKFQLLLAGLGVALAAHGQTSLRLSGSTTVKGALEPKQVVLESAVGRHLEFSGTGTSAGVVSLVNGDADVAMISTPLDEVAQALNDKTPGRVDVKKLQSTHIGDVKIVFIVNPHNPVRSLSEAQVVDILVGRVTNWKEVGGQDAPVTVVSLLNGGPLLQEQLLRGQAITAHARGVANATQIPVVVAQDRNAIGIISTAHPRGQTSLIQTNARVIAPLFLVTRGEPSADVKKLVEAARKLLATSS